MEIAERDTEIQQLHQQFKKQDQERSQIICELGLNKDTLKTTPDNEISSITNIQLHQLFDLLAHERTINKSK